MRRYSLILKPILLLAPKVDLSQKVLESLFNISKSPEYEPKTMNWKNVATKLQSLAPGYNVCTSGAAEAQQDTYGTKLSISSRFFAVASCPVLGVNFILY